MCLLQRAKLICLSMISYSKEVKNLRIMFLRNGYPKNFIDVIAKTFEAINELKSSNKNRKNNFIYTLIGVPNFGRPSHKSGCDVAKLIRNIFNVDIVVFCGTLKTK